MRVVLVAPFAAMVIGILVLSFRGHLAPPDPVVTQARRLGRLWARAARPLIARRQEIVLAPIPEPATEQIPVAVVAPDPGPGARVLMFRLADAGRHRRVYDPEETTILPVAGRHKGPAGYVGGLPLGIQSAR